MAKNAEIKTGFFMISRLGPLLAIFLLAFACAALSQESNADLLSPRLIRLRSEIQKDNTEKINKFWEEIGRKGTPMIETNLSDSNYCWVTFLWNDSTHTIRNVLVKLWHRIVFSHQSLLDNAKMVRLENSNIWYKTFRFKKDTRVSYQLSPNDDMIAIRGYSDQERWRKKAGGFIADPLNPKKYTALDGESSILELPGAPDGGWTYRNENIKHGKIDSSEFISKILGNKRDIWVYLPSGYTKEKKYNLMVFLDGQPTGYSDIPAVNILDNLIAEKKIAPVIALFIGNATGFRNTELSYNEAFANFISEEVVPKFLSRYSITTDPSKNIIVGASLGGNEAALVAFRNPHLFGNVLTQSAGFMYRQKNIPFPFQPGDFQEYNFPETEWFTGLIRDHKKISLRFRIDVGLFEDISWEEDHPRFGSPSLLLATRHLRDILKVKGYSVSYNEYSGGHEHLNWQYSLADGLIWLSH